ncbi:MAG TPA: hypothetical protein VNW90_25375 [Acetobacteraceae bacterium]|jgi:hypothetical protein|nr:hypothetical protein [Acetobacteraceae bacterium]
MPVPISDLNIQEKFKTSDKKHTIDRIAALADTLRSPTFTGEVLRVLVNRLRHPERAYTSKELEMLLLLTLALERAGMWP